MVDYEKDLECKGKSIPLASAMTSYARMRLYELITAIQEKGYKVFYYDTDSVTTNCKIRDYPDLMEKFMWDGCGDELGSLKNECEALLKKNTKGPNAKLTKEEIEKMKQHIT